MGMPTVIRETQEDPMVGTQTSHKEEEVAQDPPMIRHQGALEGHSLR